MDFVGEDSHARGGGRGQDPTGVTNQVLVWECHKVRVFVGGIEWEVMVGCCGVLARAGGWVEIDF